MASWLDRLFGSGDNEPIQMPTVKHPLPFTAKNSSPMGQFGMPGMPPSPAMFGNPSGSLPAVPGQVSMVPREASRTPVPAPKGKGISLQRPGAFTDPGLSTLPKSYTDMMAAGIDPDSDAEEIGPGFMQGFETDEEGDMEGLHRPEDPDTFMLGQNPEAPVDVDDIESPMARMAQGSMIRNVDPESGFVPGEDGVADAIHQAMQNFKNKNVAPTGENAGNDQSSMFPKDLVENLPGNSQITPDLEPLVSENSGGWGDNSAPMLRGMDPVQSQTPQFKQNLFKALLNRMR